MLYCITYVLDCNYCPMDVNKKFRLDVTYVIKTAILKQT